MYLVRCRISCRRFDCTPTQTLHSRICVLFLAILRCHSVETCQGQERKMFSLEKGVVVEGTSYNWERISHCQQQGSQFCLKIKMKYHC